jgi:protein-tyrosine phosphatase
LLRLCLARQLAAELIRDVNSGRADAHRSALDPLSNRQLYGADVPLEYSSVRGTSMSEPTTTIERPGIARRRMLGGAVAAGVGVLVASSGAGAAFATTPTATPACTPPPPAFANPLERFIWVEGSFNTRDFGGYNVGRFQQIRTGRLWRSAGLNHVDAAGVAALATLGLGQVADFRSRVEVARGLDVLPDGVTNLFVPIGDPNAAGAVLAGPPPPGGETYPLPDTLAEFRAYITETEALTSLGTALRALASDDRPVLWHCNSGTYRTGWTAAVLQTILGVARSDIYDDFALSDLALGATYTFPDYLDAAFNEVHTVYGSFLRYLLEGLGVRLSTIVQLRRHLLI